MRPVRARATRAKRAAPMPMVAWLWVGRGMAANPGGYGAESDGKWIGSLK